MELLIIDSLIVSEDAANVVVARNAKVSKRFSMIDDLFDACSFRYKYGTICSSFRSGLLLTVPNYGSLIVEVKNTSNGPFPITHHALDSHQNNE